MDSKHDLFNLMYPLGKYQAPTEITKDHLNDWMWTIEEFPTVLHGKLKGLTPQELNWVYRPKGWTIAQVVHHLADSHMNALIRFKLSLTEEQPTIKPYHEGLWARLSDYRTDNVHLAFNVLEGVHAKWYDLLKAMEPEDFIEKGYYHPELKDTFSLGKALGLYDWHCRHHREHISQALTYEGRFWE